MESVLRAFHAKALRLRVIHVHVHRSRVCVVKIYPWRRSQTQRKTTSLSYQNRKHQISVENLQASVAGFILGMLISSLTIIRLITLLLICKNNRMIEGAH